MLTLGLGFVHDLCISFCMKLAQANNETTCVLEVKMLMCDVDQVREVLFMDLTVGVTQNDAIQCVFSTPHCLISTPPTARFTITITLSPPSTSSHVGHI